MAAEAHAISALDAAPRVLRRGLRRLRRRIRALLAVRFATLALALLAGAGVPTLVLLKLRATWFPPLLPELILLGGVLLAALVALVWPLPDVLVGASADRRLSLRDRLVTALQLLRTSGLHTGMEEAAVADALEHIARVRPQEAFPLRLTRGTIVAGLCLVLMLTAQFLPLPALLLSPRQRDDRAVLQREGARIMPVAKKLEEEATRGGDVQAQQLGRRLQQLSKDLTRGKLEKKEALLKLDEADKELEQAAERLAPKPPKTAAQAARDVQDAAQQDLASRTESLALAASTRSDKKEEERLRKLAEQIRKAKTPEELKRLAQQVNRAAGQKAGRGLPSDLMPSLSLALSEQDWGKVDDLLSQLEKLPDDLTPEELAELQQQLDKLAKSLSKSDLDELSKALLKASGECKSGNCKSAKLALLKGLKAAKAKFGKLKLAKACSACKSGLCSGSGSGSGLGVGPGNSQAKYNPNAPAASLYAPRETKTSGTLTHLPGQIKPGGKMMTTTEMGAPEKVTASRVPYYEVIGEYSKSAEEALSKEDVPPAYRKSVRQYFDSLQSGSKKP